MKKISRIITSFLLLGVVIAFVLAPLPASAQATTLEQRIAEYKTKLRTAVSKTEEQRFRLRCNVAQTIVKNLQPRVVNVQTTRQQAYGNILDSLSTLNASLSEDDPAAQKLKEQTDGLATKINDFNTKMSVYRQAIDDMIAINCTEDPVGFKAALQVARDTHGELTIAMGDIRTYINNTIKPTLAQVKTELIVRGGNNATQ